MRHDPEDPMSSVAGTSSAQAAMTSEERLPLRHMLFGLFFYPHIALMGLHQQVKLPRALRIVTALCILSGMALGLARLPRYFRVSADWAGWVAREVGTLWIEDGELYWERPTQLPHTTRHRGWRVDFVPPDTEFRPKELSGPEQRGVWVGREQAFAWWRQTRNHVAFLTLLSDKKAGGVFNTKYLWPEGHRVEGTVLEQSARRIVLQSIPFLILRESMSVLFPVLIYTMVFSLVTLLFRSPLAARGFVSVLTFHLFASIPPIIVASVYSGLDLPNVDVSTVFVCAFAGYLVLVFSHLRRAAAEEGDMGP